MRLNFQTLSYLIRREESYDFDKLELGPLEEIEKNTLVRDVLVMKKFHYIPFLKNKGFINETLDSLSELITCRFREYLKFFLTNIDSFDQSIIKKVDWSHFGFNELAEIFKAIFSSPFSITIVKGIVQSLKEGEKTNNNLRKILFKGRIDEEFMKCYIENDLLQEHFEAQILTKTTFKLNPSFLRYKESTVTSIHRQLLQAAVKLKNLELFTRILKTVKLDRLNLLKL